MDILGIVTLLNEGIKAAMDVGLSVGQLKGLFDKADAEGRPLNADELKGLADQFQAEIDAL